MGRVQVRRGLSCLSLCACVLLFLKTSTWAGPGDIDPQFPKVSCYRATSLTQDADGTLWLGGRGSVMHVTLEGEVLHQFSYEGRSWSKLLPHPRGGVVVRAGERIAGLQKLDNTNSEAVLGDVSLGWIRGDGEIDMQFRPKFSWDSDVRFFTTGRRLWAHVTTRSAEGRPLRELMTLDSKGSPLTEQRFESGRIEHLVEGPNDTVYVCGYGRSLARLHWDGSLDSSFAEQLDSRFFADVKGAIALRDGSLLVASGEGFRRYSDKGVLDSRYQSPIDDVGDDDFHMAMRPDGKVMLASGHITVGKIAVDEENDYYVLARLTSTGELDASYPVSRIKGRANGLAVTDDWTYTFGVSEDSRYYALLRVEAGDLPANPPPPPPWDAVEGGVIVEGKRESYGNRSICAVPRGDGYDDLVMIESGDSPIKGLVRLVNPKEAGMAWSTETISESSNSRAVASGLINRDSLVDVLEIRDTSKAPSVHWYEGTSQRKLNYRGPIDADLTALKKQSRYLVGLNLLLADVDGDGDADAILRSGNSYVKGHLRLLKNRGPDRKWHVSLISELEDMLGTSSVDDDDSFPTDLHLEDGDRDGDPDVAIVAPRQAKTLVWFENIGGEFKRYDIGVFSRAPDRGKQRNLVESLPAVFSADRPGIVGDRWKGRLVALANINGDDKPDHVLAIPAFETDDDGDGPTWTRGLTWRRGDKIRTTPTHDPHIETTHSDTIHSPPRSSISVIPVLVGVFLFAAILWLARKRFLQLIRINPAMTSVERF